MESALKWYLPFFFLFVILLVFVLPTWRVYRQSGINPFRFRNNFESPHDFIGAVMKLFILVLFIVVLLFSISEQAYAYLIPVYYLQKEWVQIAGLFLIHFSVPAILIAQYQMRLSWRIGIDFENKTELVTTGLFRYSRNPIFLFMILKVLGFFLIIPNIMSFAVTISAYLILQITIRMEEAFLLQQHGELYRQYQQKVRRLI